MELHQAVKEIVTEYGLTIVANKQFANVLDDNGAFKTVPAATKKILKGLLDSGFGEIIYQAAENHTPNWQNSARKAVSDYAYKSGYKDEIINGLAAHLLYGLGLVDELPKRESGQPKPSSTHSGPVIKDPKELLYALKKDYIKALNELVSVTNDEFGNLYSFFSTQANTKLYVLDAKIRLVAKEVGVSDIDSWLTSERQKVEFKNRPSANHIRQSLEDILKELVGELNTLMEKSVVVSDDEFGLKSASFISESATNFNELEKKILIIGKRQNSDKTSWIAKTKSDFLASKSSPVAARSAAFDKMKNDYIARLHELDASTKSGDIDLTDAELVDLRRKIIALGSLIVPQHMDAWCDNENVKVTSERNARAARRKKRNIIICSVAGLALVIGGWQGISYTFSADKRAEYEVNMANANKAMENGKFADAVTLFQKAADDYDASYSSSSYKSDAMAKAEEASDKIISDWESQVRPLLESKHSAQAKLLTNNLPGNLVLSDASKARVDELKQKIDTDIQARASELINELFSDIYANHGTLSAQAKEELDNMIAVYPDNYWLNFIKNKAK